MSSMLHFLLPLPSPSGIYGLAYVSLLSSCHCLFTPPPFLIITLSPISPESPHFPLLSSPLVSTNSHITSCKYLADTEQIDVCYF